MLFANCLSLKSRWIILLLLILSFGLKTKAQNTYFYKIFNPFTSPGKFIIKDLKFSPDGKVWLGTPEGLYMFNGFKIAMNPLTIKKEGAYYCENIESIELIDQNTLIVGTYECGAFFFDTKAEKFTQIPIITNDGKEPYQRVNSVYKDDFGRVWAGTDDSKLFLLDKQKKQLVQIPARALNKTKFGVCHSYSIDPFDSNFLWVGSTNGFMKLDTRSYEYFNYRITDFSKINLNINAVRGIYASKDSNIYCGVWGGGMVKFNPYTNKFYQSIIETDTPLTGAQNVVRDIVYKSDTELWLVTHNYGIGIFNTENLKIDFINKSWNISFMPEDRFFCLDKDLYGNIWAGGDIGLLLLGNSKPKAKKITFPKANHANIPALHVPLFYIEDPIKKQFWVAAHESDGLYKFDFKIGFIDEFRPPWYTDRQRFLPRAFIGHPDSCFWIFTLKEALKFTPKSNKWERLIIDSRFEEYKHTFRDILIKKNGDLLLITWSDGIIIKTKNGEIFNLKQEKDSANSLISNYSLYNPFEDIYGQLWIGSDYGISVISSDYLKVKSYSYLFGKNQKLFRDNFEITDDLKGNLIIGTGNGGLFVINPLNKKIIFEVQSKKGLWTENTYDFTRKNEHLFIYGQNGLQVVNLITLKSNLFSPGSSLPIEANEWSNFYISSNSSLLFGVNNAIYTFDINDFIKQSELPAIEYFEILNNQSKRLLLSEKDLKCEFDYKTSSIKVSAFTSNLDFPDDVYLEYKMLEETEWKNFSENSNQLELTGLSPGNYTLFFRFSSADGISHSEERKIDIHISPPWHKTLIFRLFALGLIVFGVFYLTRYRQKQQNEKNTLMAKLREMENRALRAQMNPHFLFNTLNSLNYYIQKNEPQKASFHLKRFSRLMRLILNNSKKNLISLEDELEAIHIYIELESLRFDKKFNFRFFIEPDIKSSEIFLPPLLIQPYLENAIWHGLMQKESQGNLELKIIKRGNKINIIIEDDGIGREEAQRIKSKSLTKEKSQGMDITQGRVDLFNESGNGSIHIEILDLINENNEPLGTRVIISLVQN